MRKMIYILLILLIANLFVGCSKQENFISSPKPEVQYSTPISSTQSSTVQNIPRSFIEKSHPNTSVPGVTVLMYHHFLENKENKKFRNNADVVTPENFYKQMKYLHDNHFHTISLPILEKYIDGKAKLPAKTIVLTFDDGYLSVFKYAYPVLKKFHFNSVMFVITGQMKKQPEKFNPDKLNYISWPELSKYSDVFEYEGHANHFHKDINKQCYMIIKPATEVNQEIHTLHKLIPGNYFAYPYGQYNRTLIGILKENGYHMAFTTKTGRIYPGSPKFELNRNAVYPYTSFNQFKQIVNDYSQAKSSSKWTNHNKKVGHN